VLKQLFNNHNLSVSEYKVNPNLLKLTPANLYQTRSVYNWRLPLITKQARSLMLLLFFSSNIAPFESTMLFASAACYIRFAKKMYN